MNAECSSCKAPIIWAETINGKAMPIDAAPDETGNIVLTQPSDPRNPPVAVMVVAGARPPMPRYLSHFATCPNAAQHRRR